MYTKSDQNSFHFWDFNALYVNAILSLYEDVDELTEEAKLMVALISSLENGYKKYKKAKEIFDPYESDKEEWDQYIFRSPFVENQKSSENMMKYDNLNMKIGELKDKYKDLLNPKHSEKLDARFCEKLLNIHNAIVNEATMVKYDIKLEKINEPDSIIDSGNVRFTYLSNSQFVSDHADLLFVKSANQQKKLFIQKTVAISNAFLEIREGLSQMIGATLRMLILLDTAPPELFDEHEKYRIREVLSELFMNGATTYEPKLPYSELGFPYLNKTFLNNNSVESKLKSATQCVNEATTLLKIHDRLCTKSIIPGVSKNNKYFYPIYRQYGLAAGPTDIKVKIDDQIDEFRKLTQNKFVYGLDRARLSVGIDSLIEQYLKARSEWLDAPESTVLCMQMETKRERLLEELVRFADKVLFVANNYLLMKDNRNLMLDRGARNKKSNDIETYTRVLQTVGNSILVQVDEFRHQTTKKKKLEEQTGDEIIAAKQAILRDPKLVIQDLLVDIQGENQAQLDLQVAAKAILASSQTQLAAMEKVIEDKKKKIEEKSQGLVKTKNEQSSAFINQASIKDASGLITDLIEKGKVISNITSNNVEITGSTIIKKITEEIKQGFQDQEIVKIVEKHKEYDKGFKFIASRDEIKNVKIADPDKDINNLFEAIESIDQKLTDEIKEATETITSVNNVIKESEAEKEKKETEKKVLTEKIDKAGSSLPGIQKRLDLLKNALEMIRNKNEIALGDRDQWYHDEKGKPIEGIEDRTRFNVFDWMIAFFQFKMRQTQDEDEKQKYKDTLTILNEYTPSRMAPFPDTYHAENAKDVIDDIIDVLRHDLIQEVASAGKDSVHARHLREAIAETVDFKKDMIGIRPSMAYLRSSSPTSLMQETSIGWTNQLQKQFQKQIPLLDEPMINPKDLEIQQEIDKQFWQNINTVKVSGTGRTNYVIAKDDIGNWYVKGYSSNPEDIINSAKNMALFSMGSTRKYLVSDEDRKGDATLQGKQFKFVEDEYTEKTKEGLEEFEKELKEYPETLKNSITQNDTMSSVSDIFSPFLTDNSNLLKLDRTKDNFKNQEELKINEELYIDGLQQLKSYLNKITSSMVDYEIDYSDINGKIQEREKKVAALKTKLDGKLEEYGVAEVSSATDVLRKWSDGGMTTTFDLQTNKIPKRIEDEVSSLESDIENLNKELEGIEKEKSRKTAMKTARTTVIKEVNGFMKEKILKRKNDIDLYESKLQVITEF